VAHPELALDPRQSEDDQLERMAQRIRARAIRRAGELLKQIEPQQGARNDLEPRDGGAPKLTRSDAARDAGMSERQQKTALRIANVPEREFEEYDAAQERGEIKSNGGDRTVDVPNSADIGLRRDEIHDARKLRIYYLKTRFSVANCAIRSIQRRAATEGRINGATALHWFPAPKPTAPLACRPAKSGSNAAPTFSRTEADRAAGMSPASCATRMRQSVRRGGQIYEAFPGSVNLH